MEVLVGMMCERGEITNVLSFVNTLHGNSPWPPFQPFTARPHTLVQVEMTGSLWNSQGEGRKGVLRLPQLLQWGRNVSHARARVAPDCRPLMCHWWRGLWNWYTGEGRVRQNLTQRGRIIPLFLAFISVQLSSLLQKTSCNGAAEWETYETPA